MIEAQPSFEASQWLLKIAESLALEMVCKCFDKWRYINSGF